MIILLKFRAEESHEEQKKHFIKEEFYEKIH